MFENDILYYISISGKFIFVKLSQLLLYLMFYSGLYSVVIHVDLMLFLFYFMQSILESVGPTHNIDSLHEGYTYVTRGLFGALFYCQRSFLEVVHEKCQ